jgi:hypothetical protein
MYHRPKQQGNIISSAILHQQSTHPNTSHTTLSSSLIQATQHLEINLLRRTHGTLDVHLPNVLPLLLQQTGQKVGSKLRIHNDLLLVHGYVADGDVQAHDLLHLEFDRGFDLVNLLLHVLAGREEGGELSSLGEARTQETRDLLDHVIGGEEEVVLLGEFLDELLVLVELLEVVDAHVIDADAIGLFAVSGVSEHATLEVGTGDGREAEGTGETLVALGVVVLESNLDLDGFDEVALLALDVLAALFDGFTRSVGEDVIDSLFEEGGV